MIEQRQASGVSGPLNYYYNGPVSLEICRLNTPAKEAVQDFGPFANIFETLVVAAPPLQCFAANRICRSPWSVFCGLRMLVDLRVTFRH